MRTENFLVEDTKTLENLDIRKYGDEKNILVQIFSGQGAIGLKEAIHVVQKQLPQAEVIGATTDGEISNSNVTTKQIVISISIFENTEIRGTVILEEEESFYLGSLLATKLFKENLRLIIVFTDTISINAEELLDGITYITPNIVVVGGIAGNNGNFHGITLAKGDLLTLKGVVAVGLYSDTLQVNNDYNFNWQPLGKELTVTKANENILYELNGKNVIEVYEDYFGEEIVSQLPATGIEFPLIIQRGGITIARAMLDRRENSIVFAGNLENGEKVKFGIGDIEMILDSSISNTKRFKDFHVETFFIYSCMARRRLMPNHIHLEIEPFNRLAPVSGFFTYGEFFHAKKRNELLNQTMTYVALSESLKQPIQHIESPSQVVVGRDISSLNTIKSLIHLVNSTVKELNDTIEELSVVQKKSDEHKKIIDDSIDYASYIQKSVIPPIQKMNKFFKDYMVIWEPRDRVGGDIYFFEEFTNGAILIVVDAVGHGIPGALITMSIKSIQTSITKNICCIENVSPASILETFDKDFKNLAYNYQNSFVMGFDGSVLIIHKKERWIKFAGANSNIHYVDRNEEKMLKGDKSSIGYFHSKKRSRNVKFTDYKIKLRDDAKIYLLTDGLRDQIGGKSQFPFGKRKCKELIYKNFQLPFFEQRQIIMETNRKWRGENHQTDDITIIGFEL